MHRAEGTIHELNQRGGGSAPPPRDLKYTVWFAWKYVILHNIISIITQLYTRRITHTQSLSINEAHTHQFNKKCFWDPTFS